MQNTKLLNNDEAAEFLGITPATLRVWRATKRYEIPFFKIGSLVRYDADDLTRWMESRKVEAMA
jgi:excisionase family DNA binding protein